MVQWLCYLAQTSQRNRRQLDLSTINFRPSVELDTLCALPTRVHVLILNYDIVCFSPLFCSCRLKTSIQDAAASGGSSLVYRGELCMLVSTYTVLAFAFAFRNCIGALPKLEVAWFMPILRLLSAPEAPIFNY